jgi:dTDP-4-dehydrorhamnose reductase
VQHVLLLGGSGQLGTALCALLPRVTAPSRSEVDVTEVNDLLEVLECTKPDCIINCAGFTDVDRAEQDEAEAFAVNATAVGAMARLASERDIAFATFSSDYVFDGCVTEPYVESSATNPINAYGRSKVAGEESTQQYPTSLIIRTSWLLSMTHRNFITRILERAATGSLRVVHDQVGCPTFVDDLALATLRALELGFRGVLHLASQPPISRHGLAQAVLIAAGLDPEIASPCSTEQYRALAPRPRW